MSRRITWVYALLLCWSLPVNGQSLPELLELALQENQELQALRLEYQAALEKGAQVRQLPNPSVAVGAFVAPVETRLGAQRARLNLMHSFPWWGTLPAREAIANTAARQRLAQNRAAELEILFQLKYNYFEWYELQQAPQILKKQLVLLHSLRELARTMFETNKGAASDILQVDLKIQELEQKLLILQNQSAIPLQNINQLLNRPPDSPLEIKEKLSFAALSFQRDTLLVYIQQYHPSLIALAYEQEAARQRIDLNRIDGNPSFGLSLDYVLVSPRMDADPINNGRDVLQVSATASIPLYREKFKAKEREEQLRIEALEHRKNNAAAQMVSMIEQAYTQHETTRLQLELFERQIRTTHAAIDLLEARYSNDGSKFEELLRLQLSLVDYELQKLKAIVDSHQAKVRIERFLTF